MAKLTLGQPYLSALEEIDKNINQYPRVNLGVIEIPLDQVVGTTTVSRSKSFSRDFYPILPDGTEFADKWEFVYEHQQETGVVDPIKVLEYKRRFYIVEGNKRVSVLKQADAAYVTADVERVMIPKSDDPESVMYYEFLDFYQVCPIYEIDFSTPGRYKELAGILGRNLKEPWPGDVVKAVQAGFLYFRNLFMIEGGDRLQITPGDAFIIYLRYYPAGSLLDDGESLVRTHIRKLRSEFVSQTVEDKKIIADSLNVFKGQASLFHRALPKDKVLQVAFIYHGDYRKSGWLYGHELGRNHINDAMEGNVSTKAYTCSTEDDDLRGTIDQAVSEGADVIFTTSPAQMKVTSQSAIHYPSVKFLNCSMNLPSNAVRTYYGRMFEAKFLMGCLAASMAGNHKIGYAANYPIYGAVANINAFAIGASFIDPEAKIYLRWTTATTDIHDFPETEQRIYVFSGHDLIKPDRETRQYGVYKTDDGGKIINIAAPVWNWGKYYELILQSILDGTWNLKEISKKSHALSYWLGMQAGVIDIVLSDHLKPSTVKMVNSFRRMILDDTFHPFEGALNSQNGMIKGADNPNLTNEEIIQMNWLNENIVGRIPKLDELSDHAKATVEASGVG